MPQANHIPSNSTLTISKPDEIPLHNEPQGRLIANYSVADKQLKNAIVQVPITIGFTIFFWIYYLNSRLAGRDFQTNLTIMAVVVMPIAVVFMSLLAIVEWQRWRKHRSEHYAIYEDGMVAQHAGNISSYVWWFDLRDYRIEYRFTNSIALILRMKDNREYRLDNLVGKPHEIVGLLTKVLHPILVQRTVDEIRKGQSVAFGPFALDQLGIEVEVKEKKQFFEWTKILSCDFYLSQKAIVIWTRESVSVINSDNPVGYYPFPAVTVTSSQLPNLSTFLDITRTVGQFNRIRDNSTFTANSSSQASANSILQSEPQGLFSKGKIVQWTSIRRWLRYTGIALMIASVGFILILLLDAFDMPRTSLVVTGSYIVGSGLLVGGLITVVFCLVKSLFHTTDLFNPLERVTEVFQNGMIIHQAKHAHVIPWSGVAQYRIEHIASNLLGSVQTRIMLETADRQRWWFNNKDTNFAELSELLTRLPHVYLLNRVLAEIESQGKTQFGSLTVTLEGLLYKKSQLLWDQLDDLSELQNRLLIKQKGRFGVFASIQMNQIPNYFVLLALISYFQSRQL